MRVAELREDSPDARGLLPTRLLPSDHLASDLDEPSMVRFREEAVIPCLGGEVGEFRSCEGHPVKPSLGGAAVFRHFGLILACGWVKRHATLTLWIA